MPELFDKAKNYTVAKNIMKSGYYPYFIPATGEIGPRTSIQGQKTIMLGSNNYMGLTGHPEMKKAAIDAVNNYGTGCTGSRFLNGTLDLHIELEENLAKYQKKDAAITISTGYQTNLGVISSITQKGDFIISDSLNHASIVDGCRMARSETRAFTHNNMERLEQVLKSLPKDAGKLIVTDGVFSMEGDLANLPVIFDLAEDNGARVMVDDAHALGYLGPKGEGTSAHYKMQDRADIIVGTFSKSFASIGGFAVADEDVIHYIQHNARSLIFSASIPPPAVAAVSKALELIIDGDDLRKQVKKNARQLKSGLSDLGFDTGASVTPIIPVIIGDAMKTFVFWKELFDAGVYTNPVRAPAVPVGKELLRTSLMATHTEDDINEALEIFGTIGKAMKLI